MSWLENATTPEWIKGRTMVREKNPCIHDYMIFNEKKCVLLIYGIKICLETFSSIKIY